jgi:hypothetical protein
MALRACEATRPVFEHVPHLPPQFAGTGILIRLLDVPYFITAAHVHDIAPDKGLLVRTKTGIHPIYGRRYVTKVPGPSGRETDTLDLAVLRMDERSAGRYDGTEFLQQHQLVMPPTEAPPSLLLVVGFPASIQKRSVCAPVSETSVFSLLAPQLPAADYAAAGYTPDNHLLVTFDRKELWKGSKKVQSPALQGLSGGGVWFAAANYLVDPNHPSGCHRHRLAARASEVYRVEQTHSCPGTHSERSGHSADAVALAG